MVCNQRELIYIRGILVRSCESEQFYMGNEQFSLSCVRYQVTQHLCPRISKPKNVGLKMVS